MPRALLFLAASMALLAQYPGQSPYPRTPYPGGGGGLGIPMPGRGKKKPEQQKADQPMPSFAGVLKRIDAKTIEMEFDDNRTLEFRRNSKTKFVEVKESALKPGDHISIEATEDIDSSLTAVNVRLEAPAKTAEGEKAPAPGPPAADESGRAAQDRDPDRPVLRRAGEKAPAPEAEKAPPPKTDKAPAPEAAPAPPADDDSARAAAERDPNRPVLRRGKPAPRKPAAESVPEPEPAPTPVATASAVPAPGRTEPLASIGPESVEDALIAKVRATAEGFTETLPNYVVQQFIARFASYTSKPDWKPLDVVGADVVYENNRESYRNLKINGKPVKQGMEELSGAWSTGEFGTVLRNLLAPTTAAHFHLRRQTTMAGRSAVVYGYEVDRENSRWLVKMSSQSIEPAYRGAIWIDKETARVLRIEMEAMDLPEAFPIDKVETATDYGFVRLGGTAEFLLPVHSETLSCQRGTSNCSRNQIDFRNYHKYTGESNITFDKEK